MQNNQWRITGDQLWRKSPIDLKGGSNVTSIVYQYLQLGAGLMLTRSVLQTITDMKRIDYN